MLDQWKEEGFLVRENVISESDRRQVVENLRYLTSKFSQDYEYDRSLDPLKDQTLHTALIKLREMSPVSFSKIYDTMQMSATIHKAILNDATMKLAAQVLEAPESTLSINAVMLRMDVPNDKRNRLNWHQDQSYFPLNDDGNRGCVLWAPIFDATEENGTVTVCKGSHKMDYVNPVVEEGSQDTSFQYEVSDEKLSTYEQVKLIIPGGSVALFSMLLVHASGFNTSDQIRLSLGVRFNSSLRDDYHPGRLVYVPSKYAS